MTMTGINTENRIVALYFLANFQYEFLNLYSNHEILFLIFSFSFLKLFHFLNQKISFDRNFLPDQIYRFFPIRLNYLGSCSGKFQFDCFYIRRNVTIVFTSFLQYYFRFLKFFLSFPCRHYYYLENHTFLSVYKDITKSSLTLRSEWGRKDILSTGTSFTQVICLQTLFNMCLCRHKQIQTTTHTSIGIHI